MASAPHSSAHKVRRHRERLRAQGLKPVQFWVPDMNDPKVVEGLRRQMRSIAQSEQEKDDLALIDSLWNESSFDK